MPLNIDWQQILLHLFNFVILFGVLYILLYKPVKDFMDKRTAYYQAMDAEARENQAATEKMKQEYAQKLADAEKEADAIKENARKELEIANASVRKQAEEEADRIVRDARKAADREHAKMMKEAKKEITEMVTSAAGKLAAGVSTSEAFDQFLEAAGRSESDE